jgi:hypothetical protein
MFHFIYGKPIVLRLANSWDSKLSINVFLLNANYYIYYMKDSGNLTLG